MSTAMERMLERKFNLPKPIAREVAKEARETLGIGKTLLWSATYERECLRIMEKNGISSNNTTSNDPQETQFTWTPRPVEPQSSARDCSREQASTLNLSPTKSKPLHSYRQIGSTIKGGTRGSSPTSVSVNVEPCYPCRSPYAMKMVPSSPTLADSILDSPSSSLRMRPGTPTRPRRDSSPIKTRQTSPKKMQASSPMKSVDSLRNMIRSASFMKNRQESFEEKPVASSSKLHATSPVIKPYNSIQHYYPNHVEGNRVVASPGKKRLKQTEDSTFKSPTAKKSEKTSLKRTDFTSVMPKKIPDATVAKAEHLESIRTERSTACSRTEPPDDVSSHHQSQERRKSPPMSTTNQTDLPHRPPLLKRESIKRKSISYAESEMESWRASTAVESSPQICQDTHIQRSKVVHGSVTHSWSTSPTSRLLPTSGEPNGQVRSPPPSPRRRSPSPRRRPPPPPPSNQTDVIPPVPPPPPRPRSPHRQRLPTSPLPTPVNKLLVLPPVPPIPPPPSSPPPRGRTPSPTRRPRPRPQGKQENSKIESDRPVVSSEMETRRTRPVECNPKLCQDEGLPKSKTLSSPVVSEENETQTTGSQGDVVLTRSKSYGRLASFASPLKWRFPKSQQRFPKRQQCTYSGMDSSRSCNPTTSCQDNVSTPIKKQKVLSSLSYHLRRPNSETKVDACAVTVAETLSTTTTTTTTTTSNNLDDSSHVRQLTERFETLSRIEEINSKQQPPRPKQHYGVCGRGDEIKVTSPQVARSVHRPEPQRENSTSSF
jgi:hypothetical protein